MSNPSYRPEGKKACRPRADVKERPCIPTHECPEEGPCIEYMTMGRFYTDAELTAMDAAVAAKDARIATLEADMVSLGVGVTEGLAAKDAEIEKWKNAATEFEDRAALTKGKMEAAEQRIRELEEAITNARWGCLEESETTFCPFCGDTYYCKEGCILNTIKAK